jgi:hypothetical protein
LNYANISVRHRNLLQIVQSHRSRETFTGEIDTDANMLTTYGVFCICNYVLLKFNNTRRRRDRRQSITRAAAINNRKCINCECRIRENTTSTKNIRCAKEWYVCVDGWTNEQPIQVPSSCSTYSAHVKMTYGVIIVTSMHVLLRVMKSNCTRHSIDHLLRVNIMRISLMMNPLYSQVCVCVCSYNGVFHPRAGRPAPANTMEVVTMRNVHQQQPHRHPLKRPHDSNVKLGHNY